MYLVYCVLVFVLVRVHVHDVSKTLKVALCLLNVKTTNMKPWKIHSEDIYTYTMCSCKKKAWVVFLIILSWVRNKTTLKTI